MDSITGICYTVSKLSAAIKHSAANILFLENSTIALCMQHSLTANCCSKKSQFHRFLATAPTIQCRTPLITRLQKLYCSMSIGSESTKWIKNSSYWQVSWKAVILQNEWKYVISVFVFYYAVQKYYLGEWEKINQLSIAQSLSNVYVNNSESRIMFARVTAVNVVDVFLRHSVFYLSHLICKLMFYLYD